MSSTEYLGCNIETFEKHIEQQFMGKIAKAISKACHGKITENGTSIIR